MKEKENGTLAREFRFFTDNHGRLFEKYPNEYLVIRDAKVLYHNKALSDSVGWAISNGLKEGDFMLQLCSAGDKAYTHTFHSRVMFDQS